MSADRIWTVLELIQWTGNFLAQKGVENARREAEELLGHVLELDRLKLYLAFETVPSPVELAAFRALVARRAKREPLQYLLGYERFCGLRLKVDARALIPRPETERLAEMAIERFKPSGASGHFADIGTGSGCIALALLHSGEGTGYATDISEQALALASENAALLGFEKRLTFLKGAGILPLKTEGLRDLDLLISNPPYIAPEERATLQPEVRDFEPGSALFADQGGIVVLQELALSAQEFLKPGGWLMLEGGPGHAETLLPLLDKGIWDEAAALKDPFGVPRYLVARRGDRTVRK